MTGQFYFAVIALPEYSRSSALKPTAMIAATTPHRTKVTPVQTKIIKPLQSFGGGVTSRMQPSKSSDSKQGGPGGFGPKISPLLDAGGYRVSGVADLDISIDICLGGSYFITRT